MSRARTCLFLTPPKPLALFSFRAEVGLDGTDEVRRKRLACFIAHLERTIGRLKAFDNGAHEASDWPSGSQ